DIYVHRKPGSESRLQSTMIRGKNAKFWAGQLRALAKNLNLPHEVSLRDILQMPFVLEHQDRGVLFPGELKFVETQIRTAMKKADAFREREGVMLKKEALGLLKDLDARVE